jgi:Na+/melibiose symporter-like transporter
MKEINDFSLFIIVILDLFFRANILAFFIYYYNVVLKNNEAFIKIYLMYIILPRICYILALTKMLFQHRYKELFMVIINDINSFINLILNSLKRSGSLIFLISLTEYYLQIRKWK